MRPEKWAQSLTLPGAPNLWRVTPKLYRSAQPTFGGLERLREMGIGTVVNLRSFHRDPVVSGLRTESIPCKAWHPEEEDAKAFIFLLETSSAPVLVHCQHGSDRTGAMVAIFRCVCQGWSARSAIKEMTQGGFDYHSLWVGLRPFVREMARYGF